LNDKGVNLFQSPGRIVQPIPKRIYYHIKTSAKSIASPPKPCLNLATLARSVSFTAPKLYHLQPRSLARFIASQCIAYGAIRFLFSLDDPP